MYTYIYMINVYKHICMIHVYVHVYMYIHMCIYTYVCMYACVWMCVYVCVCVCVHVCVRVCMYIHMYTNVQMFTHIHTTKIHTQTCSPLSSTLRPLFAPLRRLQINKNTFLKCTRRGARSGSQTTRAVGVGSLEGGGGTMSIVFCAFRTF
jgi:hypothetical protein